MASSIASWRARIIALFRDPQRTLADALASSGPALPLALVTMPLWLTPELYDQHLRPSKARSGRTALWAAAGLWLGTLTLMSLPAIPLLQGTLSEFGKRLGYWDDQFTGPVITFLLTALSCVLFMALAAVEWSQTWIACIIDVAFGGRTISPPPFGYFATRVAGEVAVVAVLTSTLIFSAKPLNDPVWRWLDASGLVQMLVVMSVLIILVIAFNRKARTAQTCAREIYGSGGKALIYQLSSWLVMFAGLSLFTVHHYG